MILRYMYLPRFQISTSHLWIYIMQIFIIYLNKLFSSPEPKARVSYCQSAPSVVRPSVRHKLSHFQLLLWNRWTEFNETWQKARSQRPLPSLCFSSRSEKQDGRPGLWLAETFSTSPLKPLNGIQRNLTGSKISTPSTKFVFFGPIGKTRWPPWPLIGWDNFDFFSETAVRNSTIPDRMQDLNVLYQVCVFRADRKNKMAALASDRLRHFRLLLWNFWKEFNETWQEARPQRPLLSLCFSGRSEKQDGRSGLWLAEKFSTSSLKLLKGIQWNLTGSKTSTSSTKFVFYRVDRKNKMAALASDWPRHFRLLPWNRWTEIKETWQEARFNFLYQVCVFRADQKNKMATLASDRLSHFRLFLWNYWTEFNETWQEARSQRPLPSLCFIGLIGKTRWRPCPLIVWDIFDFFSETAEQYSMKVDRQQDLNVLYQVCVFRTDQKNKIAPLASD